MLGGGVGFMIMWSQWFAVTSVTWSESSPLQVTIRSFPLGAGSTQGARSRHRFVYTLIWKNMEICTFLFWRSNRKLSSASCPRWNISPLLLLWCQLQFFFFLWNSPCFLSQWQPSSGQIGSNLYSGDTDNNKNSTKPFPNSIQKFPFTYTLHTRIYLAIFSSAQW